MVELETEVTRSNGHADIGLNGSMHYEPITVVGGSGAIKTMVGYGVIKRLRDEGIPIQGFIVSSGSAFMALEELVGDKVELEKFVLSIPDLIELRPLPIGQRLIINRLPAEKRKKAEYAAYTKLSMKPLLIQTSQGPVIVNKGIYDTTTLDFRLQELLQHATGNRPKLKDTPKTQIIAQILGRGCVVLNEEFPDMYVDEAISSAIRIPQYFAPKVHEANGKIYLIMDSMGPGYFPLRKDLLEGINGTILALLYGHHEPEELDPLRVNLSGIAGYVRNVMAREDASVGEFVQLNARWATGKDTRQLAANKDERVRLIVPNLDIGPYTIKVPPETVLRLIKIGMDEADSFIAYAKTRAISDKSYETMGAPHNHMAQLARKVYLKFLEISHHFVMGL